jgi:hypothetical protein
MAMAKMAMNQLENGINNRNNEKLMYLIIWRNVNYGESVIMAISKYINNGGSNGENGMALMA